MQSPLLADAPEAVASPSLGPASPTLTSPAPDRPRAPRDASKVVVRFKATGNAPILRQPLYKITAANRFAAIIAFLRRELGWKAGDPLFLFVSAAFSPAPDDSVANLFKCFAVDRQLLVYYSTTNAFG